jgi:fibrillarin-like pre-rRNA processing protein
VYNEDLVSFKGTEYRYWNPYRSKLAAILQKNSEVLKFDPNQSVLYLGAAAGTTVSHISDIITDGRIYCVEFSERPFRDLVKVCESRPNLIPILANARKPAEYKAIVTAVDWVYQDISQRDQVEIFVKNIRTFLKQNNLAVLMVKSRSIDVNLEPKIIYKNIQNQLINENLKILETIILSPFQKDHAAFIIQN